MRKLSFLLFLPIVFFAYNLNQNRYFITQDQGFFKLYRTIGAMAKDITGKGIIWVEEIEILPKFLLADLVNKRLWYKIDAEFSETETLSFRKDIPGGSYTSGGFLSSMVGLELLDASIQNIRTTTTARILLSTSNGVYLTTNTGSTWAGQQLTLLPGYIPQVCASPVDIATTAVASAMMYGLWNNGVIYRRTFLATSNWGRFADILYDYQNMETAGADPNVPPNWKRVDDTNNYISRTQEHARSSATGNDTIGVQYSIKVYAHNSKGNYYAKYPMTDTLSRKIIELYVYFVPVSGVEEYVSGVITIIQNNKKLDLLLKNWCFSPLKTPDKVIDYLSVNKWNRISVWCDFDNGKAVIYGSSKAYEMDMDTTSITGTELRLRAPIENGYTYYIDDISIRPWIFDLVGHRNIKEKVYASTSDGIYRCDSTVWVKEFHYKGAPTYLVSDPVGTFYAFLDPEAKKVYFKETNWTEITNDLPNTNEYYSIAIDRSGNVYVGSNNYVYRWLKGTTNWTNLKNGFDNHGMRDYVKLIKNIAPISPETIYVANHNGVYCTYDSGKVWREDNDRKVEPAVGFATPTQIARLDSIFENCIYPVVTGNIGIPPDVDKDSVIHLLFMEIRDTLGDGSNNWRCSYWSSVNQFSPHVNPNSNKAEIIYVDYRTFFTKITPTVDTILTNLTDMVSWWADNNEEFWLNRIFVRYAYHKYYFAEGDNTSAFNFNLAISFDWSTDLVSPFNYTTESLRASQITYAYTMYLVGKYGHPVINELLKIKGYKVVDPMLGRRDSVILKGIESLDTLLIRKGSSFKVSLIDFAKAIVFKNIPKLPNVLFESIHCTLATYYNTFRGPFDPTNGQMYLTSRVIIFDNSFITKYGTNIARFNGGNTNDFVLTLVKEKSGVKDTIVQDITLDGVKNLYDLDLSEIQSGNIDNLYLIVNNVSTRGTDPRYAKFFITQDRSIDPTVFFGVIRSPIADRYARLFLYSRKKLFSDVGSETPIFTMLGKSLNMAYFDTLKNGTRIYTADFVIPARADTITIKAEDKAGNEYTFKYPVTIEYVKKGGNYTVSNFNIYIPEGAFNGALTLISSKNSIFISEDFLKPVTLTIPVPENMEGVAVYKLTGPNTFEEIEGVKVGDFIQVKITDGGTYILGDGFTKEKDIKTGVVFFTVNPKRLKFSLEKASNIEISIFDISGRHIQTLEKGRFAPGVYEITEIENKIGKLSSGIYFVLLKTDFGFYSRKLVNLR